MPHESISSSIPLSKDLIGVDSLRFREKREVHAVVRQIQARRAQRYSSRGHLSGKYGIACLAVCHLGFVGDDSPIRRRIFLQPGWRSGFLKRSQGALVEGQEHIARLVAGEAD